jgi:F0F1-type ATP synthase assembly protein I
MRYWANFFLPIPISFIVFVILFFKQSALTGYSFLAGSIACLLGQLCFFVLLIGKIKHKKPTGFLTRFFLAESIKLCVYAISFVCLIKIFHLAPAPTLIGFSVNLLLFLIFSFKIFR